MNVNIWFGSIYGSIASCIGGSMYEYRNVICHAKL